MAAVDAAAAPPTPPDGRPVRGDAGARFAFFTNELVGLGHIRRTLAVARCVAATEGASALVVTGSRVVPWRGMPPRVDVLKLPGWSRDEDGTRRSAGLGVGPGGLREVRSSIELAVATSFDADVVVVDKLPLGPGGELQPALDALAARRDCRIVLGLRDIDDAPERVRRKWGPDMRAALEAYYDAILVYGPPSSMDAMAILGWTDLDVPVHHVGYISWPMDAGPPPDLEPGYLLATVGGGHDGFRILDALLQGIRDRPLPCETIVITGPLMPKPQAERLRRTGAGSRVRVVEFRDDMDRLLAGAGAVVAMAGYNTVAETLRARRRALLVPRDRPSEEQLMRARVVADRPGYLMLEPGSRGPASIRAALDRLLAGPEPAPAPDAYEGAENAAELLHRLAAEPGARRRERQRA
jgi:predicted glycosyltransferase